MQGSCWTGSVLYWKTKFLTMMVLFRLLDMILKIKWGPLTSLAATLQCDLLKVKNAASLLYCSETGICSLPMGGSAGRRLII